VIAFMRKLVVLTLFCLAGCKADPPQSQAPSPIVEAQTDAIPGTPPPEATTTSSGLAFQVLKPGAGAERPALQDRVRVEYLGWSTKGPFDPKKKSGGTEVFEMTGVIAGWTQALLEMRVGERRRLWVPDKLAYPNLRANPTLWVFEVELLEILRGQPQPAQLPAAAAQQLAEPPHAPEALAAPPKDALKTQDGLAYRFRQRGAGGAKPTLRDRVVMTYFAWTSDGKLFDSSTFRGKPASLPVSGLIPGWAEGLQLMAAGDKATFWIPERLAYAGRDGAPKGMLVYEVELHEIVTR
jgi:FKBP-type peptidyl-prolyl cis-trans isomerase